MKKKNQRLIFLLGAIIAMSACGKTSFSDLSPAATTKTEIPVDPPVVVPPVVNPPSYVSKLSSGACNSDSSTSVLSCLKCNVPLNPPAPPQLSVKAKALVDIMYLACQIPNKSDKTPFRPTKEMLVQKLNRGSQALYPETTRTSQMTMVIEALTNPSDNSMRKKMFGGLYYQPPYSDAFETYFGLTVQEAKSTFCWDGDVQTPSITGVSGLYSYEWVQCQSSGAFSCQELPAYVAALGYRSQLENVLSKSISQPYVPPTPLPEKKCSWDKFEGDDIAAAIKQFKKWKAEGRQLSMEVKKADGVSQCGVADENNLKQGYTVAIASYSCQ
jgi:hypothetical protein